MKRLQAFKYELRLKGSQKRLCYRFSGACRFVYNKALALQKSFYEIGEKKLSYAGLCRHLTNWRHNPQLKWLTEVHSQVLQQSLKDLERAYQNFFAKRGDFPRFKRRGRHDGFRFPEVSEPIHPSATSVGVDVGVKRLATLSDGSVFAAINSFAAKQKQLARLQRQASKKEKFSQNWKKAIKKVRCLHHQIAHVRQDYLHKTTSTISKNHAMVFIEDLQIKSMSKRASGNKATPGKNVRSKAGLNRAILDQGWFEFRRQLEYKQAWRGGMVIAVPPKNTSRTCPNQHCGCISVENRQTQARFVCVACGYENHADVVGAINVLRAGHARLACGETVQLGRSMNQEPTEVIQKFVV